MDKIKLRVEGMVCGHCEIAINDAVRKLPGIKKSKASKRKKEVTVEYDASLTTPNEIINAIGGTGYKVVS
ncbi:MAG: cation transporter [Oscillospiraceae bacterium]|jgi:copper chaperone CopZ|nr:cation transporter [Oscillospiraceae bacterium]